MSTALASTASSNVGGTSSAETTRISDQSSRIEGE